MHIPFMRLDRQFEHDREGFLAAVTQVFTHGNVLQGPETIILENRLANLFSIDNAVVVGSGTDALIMALRSLNLPTDGKVAVTSLSFIASASAIVHTGSIPVFVDVEDKYLFAKEDVLFDLVDKKRVDAVIAVHLYGQMTELSAVHTRAREQGIPVIEDAAQALGATRHKQAPGCYSEVTCVSFDPTKVIGAHGSGGALLTADPEQAKKLRKLRYHGHAGNRIYTEIGYNSQLPTVQAALINRKLDFEISWRERRQAIAAAYDIALAGHPDIQAPTVRPDNTHVYHKYVVRVPARRNALISHLKNHGIDTSVHYSVSLHKQPCFAGRYETAGDMDRVTYWTGRILSLPIYPELTDTEVAFICNAVNIWRA
ncbi:putative DegT/DnrJ/EryC1/StrS [Desulfovibrionales bacterium]